MRHLKITLAKYVSKEIWAVFLTCLMIFMFIIMATYMIDLTNLIINYGVGFGALFSLILCQVPRFILFAMPISCLMAVLLSFIRMSSDNEIIALHSSGISLYQMMPPVILFSVICMFFSVFLTLFWVPYGNRTYESVSINIMKSRADFLVKERIFGNLVKDVVFYVNSYSPKSKIMKDVFVVDKRKGNDITFVAKKAKFIPAKNGVVIRFIDGISLTDDGGGKSGSNKFGSLDYPIEINSMLKPADSSVNDPGNMYPEELLEFIKSSSENIKKKEMARMTLFEMFSLPLAVFVIGIAGAPLGAQIRAHGRTKGIIISLLLFLSYYIILMVVRYMCENGTIIPGLGAWLPVLFLALINIFLLLRSAGKLNFSILSRI